MECTKMNGKQSHIEKSINRFMHYNNLKIHFSIDRDNFHIVVKVTRKNSDEVIREIDTGLVFHETKSVDVIA